MRSIYQSFPLQLIHFMFYLRKAYLSPKLRRYSKSPFRSLIILHFIFRSLLYCELILIIGVKQKQIFFPPPMDIQLVLHPLFTKSIPLHHIAVSPLLQVSRCKCVVMDPFRWCILVFYPSLPQYHTVVIMVAL